MWLRPKISGFYAAYHRETLQAFGRACRIFVFNLNAFNPSYMNHDFQNQLEKIQTLQKEVNVASKGSIASVPRKEGLYCIWWTGPVEELKNMRLSIALQGKHITNKERNERPDLLGKHHIHTLNWDWNIDATPVCLYVGKSSDMRRRLNEQFELGTTSEAWYSPHKKTRSREHRLWVPNKEEDFLVKRRSGCQVRAGIEHLYKAAASPSTIEQKLHNIGLSYLEEPCFKERFYMEDLAIGYFRPWFNLDSER